MTDLTIILPLPPEALHPNGRTRNYSYRAALIRKARGDAKLVASIATADRKPLIRAWIDSTWYMPRRRDEDGLIGWLKPYIDGLADAGVVVNDSGVTLTTPVQVTGKTANGKREVVLTVRNDE